jgi:hypothetical protein
MMPMIEITPNNWFDQLNGLAQPVSKHALLAAGLLPEHRVERSLVTHAVRPEAPGWRRSGTSEWQVFHKQSLSGRMPRIQAG